MTAAEFDRRTPLQRKSVAALPTAEARMNRIHELRKTSKEQMKRAKPKVGKLALLVGLLFALSGPAVHIGRAAIGSSTYHAPEIACICASFLANFVVSIPLIGMIFEWTLNRVSSQLAAAKKLNAVVQPIHR